MKDRRNYGLQLHITELQTFRLERYTPRNLDIAFAMVDIHRQRHHGEYVYRILDYSDPTFDTIVL